MAMRFDVLDLGMTGRRNAPPGVARVGGAEDAVQRTGNHGVRSRAAKMAKLRTDFPCIAGSGCQLAAVVAGTENVAAIVLDAPGGNVNGLGVGGINHDVVQHVVVAAAQVGVVGPTGAAIAWRDSSSPGAGAQENAAGIMRVVRQAADVAAFRTERDPAAHSRLRFARCASAP